MAVALAAFLMAQAGNMAAGAQGEAGLSQVRQLEQPGKLLDATVELPEAVRQAIGYSESTPESEAGVAAAAADYVLTEAPWSRRLRYIGAAMAVGFDDKASALRLLSDMPPRPVAGRVPNGAEEDAEKLPPSPEGLERRLRDMTAGKAAPDWESLRALLASEHASQWLMTRVHFRHRVLVGDPDASETLAEARQTATQWVNINLAHNLSYAGLVIVGFLLLIGWPLLKRVVAPRRRRVNPLDNRPPFDADALQGVLAWWFLGHIAMGVLSGVFGAPNNPTWLVTSMIVGSFVSGGLALALIQRRARRLGDLAPMSMPLQFHTAAVTGGRWTLPLWALGGLAVCLFFMTAGLVLNIMVLGAPTQTQASVEALSNLSAPLDIALAFIAVCIAAPLVEEIIFRGFVFQSLKSKMGPVFAMLLSGFLFGLVHLDMNNLLPLAALGVGLAFVFEWSGSLWVPILVHGLFNLLTALRIFTLSGM